MKVDVHFISVIIPCYNVETYIDECIESVYEQTYTNIEVICVDNNSTDGTLNKLLKLQSLYPNLFITEEKRPGAPIARNTGLTIAKGDLIQYLDADDVIDSLKFEKQIKGFQNSETDIVVSDRIIRNEDLSLEIERLSFEEIETDPLNTALSKIIITGNPLYRKSTLLKIGGFDESLNSAQDWDLNIRLVLSGAKIKYIPGFYFITRKLRSSLSSNWVKVSIQAAELLIGYKSILNKNELSASSLNKICSILYESSLRVVDRDKREQFFYELQAWAKLNKFLFLSPGRRLVRVLFGLRTVFLLDKFMQNNKS